MASETRTRRAAALALAAAVSALVGAPAASAQDTHYWSIQYGPIGQLVGGQLIGGVSDLSGTYYNPGALALENESSYLLSTESVQWESVGTDSSAGIQVLDTSSSRFGAAPSLIAGVLPRWFGQRTRLAWSFLTRQQFDVRLGQRLTDPLGPGVHSAAESYFDQDAEEDWGGLTFSRQLSQNVGVGLTWYGVYRGQRTRKELSLQAVAADGAALAVSGVSDFEYTHYRTLAKLGLAWRSREWKAGLSVTTPSLGAFGSGKAAYTLSLTGNDKDADGRPDPPVLVTDTKDDLDSAYRSSWAVGLGASRRLGNTTLYASAEWYASVGRFAVIELPADAPEAGGLTQALSSVLNAGVGVEHVLGSGVSVYGAFHTDFSAATGEASQNVTSSDWDIYHLSGGLAFRFRDNRFTLGASWARGHKDRPLDSPIPASELPTSALGEDVAIHYSKVTILFGFVFGS